MSDTLAVGIVICGCLGGILVILSIGIDDIKKRLDRLTELVEKLGEQQHQRNYGHPEERP